jgi:glycosyltransferase involved in cell wall biosynthesis
MLENDRNLNEDITTYRYSNKTLFPPKITIFIEIFGAYIAIKKIIHKGFKPNIIHAHISRAGFDAVLLGKMLKCPVVISEHNSAFPRQLVSRFDIAKAKFAFPKAKKVLPVSLALQKGIESYRIKANFQVVHNVVDTSLFFPSEIQNHIKNNIKIIFVGSLIPIKGLDFLFPALASMNIKQKWHLDLVGESQNIEKYQLLCEELKLSENVTFHGYLPKQKIAQMMRQSDIFVLPSLYESMPCVMIEAMASGLPIVSTIVGGIPEIVDSETGILCQAGDVFSLRNALINIIDNLEKYNNIEISRKAYRFSPEEIGKQLHDLYKTLLNN